MKPPSLLLLPLLLFCQSALAQTTGDCADLTSTLREVRLALDEVRLEDALAQGERAEQGLTCQPAAVNTLSLTSLYQLLGSVHFYLGEPDESERYYGKAVAVAPGSTLDPAFGERAGEIYEDVRLRTLSVPTGSLLALPGVTAWLNGRPLTPGLPADVASGSHLVQVQRADGGLTSNLVRVASGQSFSVRPDGRVLQQGANPLPAQSEPGQMAADSPAAGPATGWLVAGGGAVILGSVAMGLAAASHTRFDKSTDLEELHGLRTRTNVLGTTGLTLSVAGAGLVGVAFIVPTATSVGLAPGLRWSW